MTSIAALLERLTANAVVATALGSILASSDTMDSEGSADETVLNKIQYNEKS